MTAYKITKEQLESLVEDAQCKDAAAIIANAVMRKELSQTGPPLPHDTGHDGNGLAGLKRIYRWVGWEMGPSDFWENGPRMSNLKSMVGREILSRDPKCNLDDNDNW